MEAGSIVIGPGGRGVVTFRGGRWTAYVLYDSGRYTIELVERLTEVV